MDMTSAGKGLTRIHLAVLLFGVSGLLGKMIEAAPLCVVFGRSMLAALALGLAVAWFRPRLQAPVQRHVVFWVVSGLVLAAHWWAFFESVKISTVALALLTFSAFPMFVVLLEVIFLREKLRASEWLAAALVTLGLVLVTPEFDFAARATQGAIWGLISGFTFAVLTLLNRKFARQMPPLVIAAGQMGVAALALAPLAGAYLLKLSSRDAVLMLALGLVCTAVAHGLFIQGLARVKARSAAIIAALEPVYGIVLAVIFLREIPGARTIAGGCVIFLAATWTTLRRERNGEQLSKGATPAKRSHERPAHR